MESQACIHVWGGRLTFPYTLGAMEAPGLQSVRAKIDRAKRHFDAISSALRVVLGTEPEAEHVLLNKDYERQQLVVVIPRVAPIDPTLPLMVGDCVHNLRSALDHLVYRLAIKNGASPECAEKTFFPIYLTKDDFDRRVKKLVKPFISDAALAEIENSQPYTAYDVPDTADIWVLHQLDIIDKHRLLIVAGQRCAVTEFTVTVPTGERFHQVIAEPKWKPMKDGTEIIRFDLFHAISAPGKVRVQIDMVKSVQFADTGLACDGVLVQDALTQCIGIVSATVRDFGKEFFGE